MKPYIPDYLTMASILGIITANQEQIEWWLRCVGAIVAIVAGLVAIIQRINTSRKARRLAE